MKYGIGLFFGLLFPAFAWSNPSPSTEWQLTDLKSLPELASFFGNADAVITHKAEPSDETIRPTVFVYKLPNPPAGKLASAAEWQGYLKPFIKDVKKVILKQDSSKSGRYVEEFTSRHNRSQTDLRSLYLAIQNPDESVTLFIYDGVGPSTSRNLPLVHGLFSELDQTRLMQMHQAYLDRRKEDPAATKQ